MDTKQVLKKMLKENTGSHFLDSGGAYGRHWEKNQKRNFDKEPETILSGNSDYIEVTLNLYHWLNAKVEFNPEWDKKFHVWARKPANKEENWFTLMQEYPEYLKSLGYEIGGIYGNGEPFSDNSYNHENMLSQEIQFTYFTVSGDGPCGSFYTEEVILLQIHNGCDVRGGYTKPRAFQCTDEMSIFNFARATIACTNSKDENQVMFNFSENENSQHYWDTDDSNHWYFNGTYLICPDEGSLEMIQFFITGFGIS